MLNITREDSQSISDSCSIFFFHFQRFSMFCFSDLCWLLCCLSQTVSGWGSLLCQYQCASPRWELWLFPRGNSAPPQRLSRGSFFVSASIYFTFINLHNLKVLCSGVFVPVAASVKSSSQLLFVFSLSGCCWSVWSYKQQHKSLGGGQIYFT